MIRMYVTDGKRLENASLTSNKNERVWMGFGNNQATSATRMSKKSPATLKLVVIALELPTRGSQFPRTRAFFAST